MTDVYPAVEAIAREVALPVAAVCDLLDVSRSAYYAWQSAEPGPREQQLGDLTPMIVAIFVRHRRRYGARRIAAELRDRDIVRSPRRVAAVPRGQGLRAIQPRSFVPRATHGRHTLGYSPNLLPDQDDPTRVNELWVADITYLPLRGGGFCYLAGLMDRYSRAIAGWSSAASMAEPLVIDALRQAIRERQPRTGLIHHSDRGGQYAGTPYRALLDRAGMRQSMSRAENSYDNAFMGSCWAISLRRQVRPSDFEI